MIELITGPMFAGKSRMLYERLNRADSDGASVGFLRGTKPPRNGPELSPGVCTMRQLPLRTSPYHGMLGVDEIQFADEARVDALVRLSEVGCHVLCAGLDTDFMQRPFPMVQLLSTGASIVHKLMAQCSVCGKRAQWSKRLSIETEIVSITATYQPRCTKHWP